MIARNIFYRVGAVAQRYLVPPRLSGFLKYGLFILFFLSLLYVSSQNNYQKIENTAFQRGEFLKYRVFYDSWMTSWMTAGFGTMEIDTGWAEVKGRPAYHVTVTGTSHGMFNLFYKVRDQFESYIDREEMVSLRFLRHTREGNYKREDDVYFDHERLMAKSLRKEKPVTPRAQDMVSAFYFVRTWNFDSAKVNDKYHVDFFLDDSLYHSEIIFQGREKVKTDFGEINCLKFKPRVAEGEIFQEQYPMELWVTDDRNKIPVLIRSAVFIGSVKIELIEYRGLKWPLGKR